MNQNFLFLLENIIKSKIFDKLFTVLVLLNNNMNNKITNRFINVLHELETIETDGILLPSNMLHSNKLHSDNITNGSCVKQKKKKKNKIKKQKGNDKRIDENLVPETSDFSIQNKELDQIDYTKETHIFSKCSQIYLPNPPVPFKVLKIINLGVSQLKILSNENENIYHNFYSPNGSTTIFVNTNSILELFYIENETGEKLWIAK